MLIGLLDRLRDIVAALGAGAITGLALPAALAAAPEPVPSVVAALPDTQSADTLPDHSRKNERLSHAPPSTQRYDVTFWNMHTRQLLYVGTDAPPSPAALSRFLRCRVTGTETTMSPVPFAVATEQARREGRSRVHVVSGYRSPKFNSQLRKKGREVAESSYHMLGNALDFRIPGVATPELTTHLEETHDGGVGRYRESNFVHVDDGPRRRWRGH